MRELAIHNLSISRDGAAVVRDASLSVPAGAFVVLMGPNGSGKSSLALGLMGHPKCAVEGGRITLDSEDITGLRPDERARKGLFLSPQKTPEIPGVSVSSFLRLAVNSRREAPVGPAEFHALMKEKMAELGIPASFAGRGLNEQFSGGEKKRMEILQLSLLQPKYAILDETDAGLDVDALKIVAAGIAKLRPAMGVLAITHHAPLLELLPPDKVYAMLEGRIVAEGGPELAEKIKNEGYGFLKK